MSGNYVTPPQQHCINSYPKYTVNGPEVQLWRLCPGIWHNEADLLDDFAVFGEIAEPGDTPFNKYPIKPLFYTVI